MNRNVWKRAERVLEIATAMAKRIDGEGWTVQNRIEEIQLHGAGYAEPGYSSATGIVATGNWNTIDRYSKATNTRAVVSDLPGRIFDIFEKMGIEGEWSDEWTECSHCGKLVRTSGDSYSWAPSYVLDDDGASCVECIEEDPGSYLESLEGNASTCVTIDSIDPTEHGYVRLNEDSYESGWHPGQNDDPKKIAKELEARGIERYLFKLDENSQFYSKWSVYVHEDEQKTDPPTEPESCETCGSTADMTYSAADNVWHCGSCGIANMPVKKKE